MEEPDYKTIGINIKIKRIRQGISQAKHEKRKEDLASKLFWTGMIIGFTLGALHNYFGL